MKIIGLSANFHDSACALIVDGKVLAMIPEERLSRIKNDSRLPIRAFRKILKDHKLTICDIDRIAYYEEPSLKIERQLASAISTDFSARLDWLNACDVLDEIRRLTGFEGPIDTFEHHLSHAAASYYLSGFSSAAILTTDAIGEWASSTGCVGSGLEIEKIDESRFPNSVGLLYSTITSFLGFKVMSGEYKVMGLAPYGNPEYIEKVNQLYTMDESGQISLDMDFFDFGNLKRMYSPKLEEHIGLSARKPESEVLQCHMDLAKSLQLELEKILFAQAKHLRRVTNEKNLCLSGGVSLNCVAVGKIKEANIFDNVYVPPAPGDSGSAIGCALLSYYGTTKEFQKLESTFSPYLGPSYSPESIERLLNKLEIEYQAVPKKQLMQRIAELLDAGSIIGYFQGRMEIGPRSLGSRSILADPRRADMRDKLNKVIKKRENFRPFAPAILEEYADKYLNLKACSPYMSYTCKIISDISLPAVTHIDGSCRPQTVSKELSPNFHALITAFYELTGCAAVVNTSFNVRGEPVVCSPIDALRCFAVSNLDYLVLEDSIIQRSDISDDFIDLASHDFDYIKAPRDLFTRKDLSAVYTFT